MNVETLRVLVHTHPEPDTHFEPQRTVWFIWASQSNTHLILWPHSQYDTDYLRKYSPNSIIVGGQMSFACVQGHLVALTKDEQVLNQNISVYLSRSATYGEFLEEVIEDVYRRTRFQVGKVD